MKKIIFTIIMVIILAGSSVFAACAPESAPAPAPKPTGSEGTLTVAVGTLGDEVWLADKATSPEHIVLSHIGDAMFQKDEAGKLTPGLVEKWELSPDGLAWTFNLRKGVQFHGDWGEFTAEDFIFTFELCMAEDAANIRSSYYRKALDRFEVVDPHTVIIHTQKPAFDLAYNLARVIPRMPIASKKYVESVGIEEARRHPIGTGPFKFVEHKVGEYVEMEAVEGHWRKTPAFKTVIVRIVPEDSTRMSMLRTGEADIIEIALEFKEEMAKAGLKTKSVNGAGNAWMQLGGIYLPDRPGYDPNIPWFLPNEPERALKVRKALNLAVNREEMVEHILMGEGSPSPIPHVFPNEEAFNPAWKPYPYDPEGAKKLLAEAGYPDGFPVTVALVPQAGRPHSKLIGEAVGNYWAQIGLDVSFESIDYASWRERGFARDYGQEAWCYAAPRYDEPIVMISVQHWSKGRIIYGIEHL